MTEKEMKGDKLEKLKRKLLKAKAASADAGIAADAALAADAAVWHAASAAAYDAEASANVAWADAYGELREYKRSIE